MLRRERVDSQIKIDGNLKTLLERNQTSDLMADSSSPRAFWRESERDIWGDTNIEFYYAPLDGARGQKINKMNVNKVRYSVFLFRRNTKTSPSL